MIISQNESFRLAGGSATNFLAFLSFVLLLVRHFKRFNWIVMRIMKELTY